MFVVVVSLLLVGVVAGCAHRAIAPSWTYTDFKEVTVDPFPGMSFQGRTVQLTPDELKGRIVWNLWTATTPGSGTGSP
jgi:hypothetical protein